MCVWLILWSSNQRWWTAVESNKTLLKRWRETPSFLIGETPWFVLNLVVLVFLITTLLDLSDGNSSKTLFLIKLVTLLRQILKAIKFIDFAVIRWNHVNRIHEVRFWISSSQRYIYDSITILLLLQLIIWLNWYLKFGFLLLCDDIFRAVVNKMRRGGWWRRLCSSQGHHQVEFLTH